MRSDIERLDRRIRRLNLAVVGLGSALVLVLGAAASQRSDVIRTKGIVIEDAQGRARILIGAPLPIVAERLRTSPDKYETAFGGVLGKYASGVGNLRNDAVGMLILDENGHDRVALGGPGADPLNGRRIGEDFGLTFNGPDGIERGGIGHLLNVETGLDRAILGLDGPEGEGAMLIADSDGTNGLLVFDHSKKQSLLVGRSRPGGLMSQKDDRDRLGLATRDENQAGVFVGHGSTAVEALRPTAGDD